MTQEDDILQDAIIDELNAEMGRSGISMKELAAKIGRPYDSTRNYLKKERPMPLGVFIECANAIGITPDQVIKRAKRILDE